MSWAAVPRRTAAPARLRAAVTTAALAVGSFTVAGGLHAAFTAQAANPASTLSAGSVAVDSDIAGTAPLTGAALGASDTTCTTLTSTGTLPSTVRHYATTTGALPSYLNVEVVKGSGAAGPDDCTGFTPDPTDYGLGPGVVHRGALGGLGTSWANGTEDPGLDGAPGYGPTVAATSGLVNHWRLGTTTTYADTQGGATGTWSGSPTVVPGIPDGDGDGATAFDGVDDTGEAATSLVGDDLTVAFWFRSTQGLGPVNQWYNSAGLVDNSTNGYYYPEWGTALSANGTVIAGFGDGSSEYSTYSTPGHNDGQWHHVAVTYVRGTGIMTLHLDGQPVGTATSPLKPRVQGRGRVLLGQVNGYPNYFAGALDEVTTHDRALSATEIASLFSSQVPPELWTAGESHSYRITTTIRNDAAAAGTSGTVTLAWEARNR